VAGPFCLSEERLRFDTLGSMPERPLRPIGTPVKYRPQLFPGAWAVSSDWQLRFHEASHATSDPN
jgi:hypothetical protein